MRKKSTGAANRRRRKKAVELQPWQVHVCLKAKRWIPISAQIATIVIGLVGLVIMTVQLWISSEQLKLMNQPKSIANDRVNVARFMQRAYLEVQKINADLQHGEIQSNVENVGGLPANRISVSAKEIRASWDSSRASGSLDTFKTGEQLFPGQKVSFRVPLPTLERNELERIVKRTDTLFLNGTIDYEDGFGNPDTTTFAFEYKPPPNEGWTPRPQLIAKNGDAR
jgi:hypothetical protein